MKALRMRRRAPADSFHYRRLALGVFGADAWPHRGARPRTMIAKLAHLAIGMVLGAVFAAIVLAWIGAGCPS
jgi:hypothetical protein